MQIVCRKIYCTIFPSRIVRLKRKMNKANLVLHGIFFTIYFYRNFHRYSFVLYFSFLRDSLQLQHSTNLNIQRSQSTNRFAATSNTNIGTDDIYPTLDNIPNYTSNINASTSLSASASDSNYIENSNFYGKFEVFFLFNLF